MTTKAHAVDARFWAKVRKTRSRTGCWVWTAGKFPTGYGMFRRDGRVAYAHRTAYELANGPIPVGLVVRHSCDRPECVNPVHLTIGTHQDNVDDCVSRKRHAHGIRIPNHRLSDSQVQVIRSAYATGLYTQQELADLYGVSRATVGFVVNGRTWKHVTAPAPVVAGGQQ